LAAFRLTNARPPLLASPHSAAFALMLSAMAALPSFGIDMSLPALNVIGSSLGVSAGSAGWTITVFMLGYGLAPPICGPISDRIGRKPVILGAVGVFAVASLGATVSSSLAELLAWRLAQGMGGGVAATLTLAVINDLFDGAVGRAKLSHLASIMLFVPMLAPTAGTFVLAIGGWRGIYGLLSVVGVILFSAIWLAFGESARPQFLERFRPMTMLHGFAHALSHPACLGYILVNAAGFAAIFAYISGSSLFLIGTLGLSRPAYSVIYAVTFIGIMAGVMLNGRLSLWGVAPAYPLRVGIGIALGSATLLVVALAAGWIWVPGLTAILILSAAGFGLIAPNAMHAAMQPLPHHAGAVSAMAAFVQVLAQSASSAFVFALNDRAPGLSMAASMMLWPVVCLIAYLRLARPAEISLTPTISQGD
jgi:DHA1 family bicyclomycin/chloramphenicol resistance-like MFS transporter